MTGPARLTRLLMRIFGVHRDADSGLVRFPAPRFTIWRFSLLAAGLYLAPILALQLTSLTRSPEFGPASLVEETAYTYISAGNFLRFGFLNSGLLQDFSSSPHPEDHPFVYVHMPAGPDVLTAILLRATRHNYALTRGIFAVIFIVGLLAYARFVESILREQGLAGGAFAILFVGPWIIAQGTDRLIYSPFPLLAFGPIVLLSHAQASAKRIWIGLGVLLAFVASIYLEYSLLSGVLVCWVLIYELKLLPGGRRYAVALVLPAVAGILGHLMQNVLFLGPEVFLKELVNVVSNRMTGFPTQEALKAWYQEIGVVHHGSKPVAPDVLFSQIIENSRIFGRKLLLVIALTTVIVSGIRVIRPWTFVLKSSNEARVLVRLITWSSVVILTPVVVFPAFAQEVTLRGSGANQFFLATAAIAVCSQAVAVAMRWLPVKLAISSEGLIATKGAGDDHEADIAVIAKLFVCGLILALTLTLALVLVASRTGELLWLTKTYRESDIAHLAELRQLRGSLFMTNINVPLVSYYLDHPGFGVCNPQSVSDSGKVDVSHCKVAFVRRQDYWTKQAPRFFVYFSRPSFFPGFADCIPEGLLMGQERMGASCVKDFEATLRRHFPSRLQNSLVTVFELR